MKKSSAILLAGLLVLVIGMLLLSPRAGHVSEAEATLGRPSRTQIATSPTSAVQTTPTRRHLPRPFRVEYPENFVTRTTNGYIITYSNIVIRTAVVAGPMEKFIGSDYYEKIARQDFDESVGSETHLRKIRDLIESDRPGSDRLFSAVRLVYEMRADVLDMRHDRSELEFSTNARIGQLQADSSLSPEERERQILSAMNNLNAGKIAQDVEQRERYDRFLSHLTALVGELSESTMERFAAFDPQFAPRRLQPPQRSP
jgi:hypothetical protein